ncbi:asparagine-rich protein [Solenopsis invicta]|uniref:asparagine-rich protein n=1 Tax=Solenopsis invicta TaxID=13686 RepID=UPI000E33DDAC|nr:asparagine-rich protein [Solenopsis invicta]
MYYQRYDSEEEFEPRVIPKPLTKHDCFVKPTVPEVSLIFEKSTVKNQNNGRTDLLQARSVKPVQFSDGVEITNSILPISHNSNSYAAWKEQNYSREITSTNTTCISPLYKNTDNYTLPSSLQNASIQKQQEQADANNKQKRLQNASKNDRVNEKIIKFQCSNTENSYDLKSRTHLLSSNKHLSSDSGQKTTLDMIDCTTGISNNTSSNSLKKPQHFQTHQQFHVPQYSYSNCNTDNNETIKTLLQLINSQNDQIKNLQFQIDRLVRMQEENFKNKSACSCSQHFSNQIFKYPINCYDTALASFAQSQNQGNIVSNTKKNIASQNISGIENQGLENFGENKFQETALLEQSSKKTFMEQKVSIGVMTSLEFTVQNSPFLIDSEISEKKEAHRENNNISRMNTINIHDTMEPVNRYKNTLSCKPGVAQLENIVEDSESYLSSSQQQSSNFNTDSVKETLKMYQHHPTDLNWEKIHKGIYNIGKDANINKQAQNAKEISNMSMNVDYSPIGSAICSRRLIEQTNDYITIDGNTPITDYFNDRNKEYSANDRQIKDVSNSMVLSEGDLKIFERPPPTPEPSIRIEIQEYVSDDESDTLRRTPKIGWTIYKNVLGQVKEILDNSDVISNKDLNNAKTAYNNEQENDMETRALTVKATLEELRKLGSNDNEMLDFDSSFYPRLDHQANMTHLTSSVNETNISMHMKALASKYLSDKQLADIALQKQESSLTHFMMSNMQGTNMSLATRHYLEKYQLLPGKNNI